MPHDHTELNRRELAILRAVHAGRGELLAGCEPHLAIDGGWCDHAAVRHLVAEHLITAARPAATRKRVRAVITEAGKRAITANEPATPQAA